MPTTDLDSMHHEDCYVRSMAHVFERPECNCTVRLVRELEAENERLRGEIRYALESLRPDTVKGAFARQAIESLRRVAG